MLETHATSIGAIPLLNGIRKDKIEVRMAEMPEIPDKPITFEEMAELMDGNQIQIRSRDLSPKKSSEQDPIEREEKQWKRITKKAKEQLEAEENEYESLLKDLQNAAD